MICQMPFEINRVFVTHSVMPLNLYLPRMLYSNDVSGLVLWADVCSDLWLNFKLSPHFADLVLLRCWQLLISQRVIQIPTRLITILNAGQNVSMTLINWTIGNASMKQAPAAAPGAAVSTPEAAPATAPAAADTAATAPLGPSQANPDLPLPSGQAVSIDPSTPFFLGGVTATSTPMQAMANFTVVDVPVRTIATKNKTLAATIQLAIAHR